MRPMRIFPVIFVVLVMAFAANPARGQGVCWGYQQYDAEPCSGHNCSSSWVPVSCDFGCVSGSCNQRGDSTECCGVIEYYAQIFPDGDNCDAEECNGNSGLFRTHAGVPHVDPQHAAELRQGYSPGLIMLSENVSYRPARLVYVFNRCSRRFKLMVENDRIVMTGGL